MALSLMAVVVLLAAAVSAIVSVSGAAIGVVRELATLNVDHDDANQFAMTLSLALEKRKAEREQGEQEEEEQQEEKGQP